ncbi:MAG TPA: hypothetical protein VJ841_03650 [Candidatus Saccharimonadales bacterium]|nr:hypothetical protein [Candidatus Saccharimonadales bacterium]
MKPRINDNEVFSKKSINDNVNDNERFRKEQRVESIAAKLVDKLKSPESWEFYCKVARSLPEDQIWRNYEDAVARSKSSVGGLFNYLCRRSMYKANRG